MVIKPEEIVNWENAGEDLERRIDVVLRSKWQGQSYPVRFELPRYLPLAIVAELIRKYTKAGWNVKHSQGDCQRDGAWNTLSFSKR